MRNLFILSFDRGLSPLEGLLTVEDLVPVKDPIAMVKGFKHRCSQEYIQELVPEELEELLKRAKTVRAHNAIRKYFMEMMEEGILEVSIVLRDKASDGHSFSRHALIGIPRFQSHLCL